MTEIASFDHSQLVVSTHLETEQNNADEIFGVTTLIVNAPVAAAPELTSLLILGSIPLALFRGDKAKSESPQ